MFKKNENKVSKGVFSVKVPLGVMLAVQECKERYPEDFEDLSIYDTALTLLLLGLKLFAKYKEDELHEK